MSDAAAAIAWHEERAAYFRVIVWRSIYGRARSRMARMHPSTAARLHHRLKDREYDAIEVHQAAERRLRSFGGARRGGMA